MKNVFYNVARQDITNGLTDFEISSGQDYFILLKAPANANVKVRLNSNTAPQIPIYEFWQFKSADVEKIYLSADAINGEYIEYGQADGNVEITTNPQIGSIDSLASVDSFGVNLLNSLDKIINPYELVSQDTVSGSPQTVTDLLYETIQNDKIVVTVTGGNFTSNYGHLWGRIMTFVDAKCVHYFWGTDAYNGVVTGVNEHTIINKKGKNLTINAICNGTGFFLTATIKRYNLKA